MMNAMTVTVEFESQLRGPAGCSRQTATLPEGRALRDLLHDLAAARPELRPHLFADADSVRPSLLLFVNNQPAAATDVLSDGATVTLVPPIAGG